MSDFNQFNLYSMSTEYASRQNEDFVDEHVNNLRSMNEYEEVLNYINKHFSGIQDKKEFEYPEINKQIFIEFKEDAVEFFAAKNRQQFFGKGWKRVEGDKLE